MIDWTWVVRVEVGVMLLASGIVLVAVVMEVLDWWHRRQRRKT